MSGGIDRSAMARMNTNALRIMKKGTDSIAGAHKDYCEARRDIDPDSRAGQEWILDGHKSAEKPKKSAVDAAAAAAAAEAAATPAPAPAPARIDNQATAGGIVDHVEGK